MNILVTGGAGYIGSHTTVELLNAGHKVIIAETKGEAYANDTKFQDKKAFVKTEFLRQNNEAFGYERFEYLYLEDALPEHERLAMTQKKICEFFEE